MSGMAGDAIAIRFASNFPFQMFEETVSSTVTSSQSEETQEESWYSMSLKTQLADARRGSILTHRHTPQTSRFADYRGSPEVEGQSRRTAHAYNIGVELDFPLRCCSARTYTTTRVLRISHAMTTGER